MAERTSRLSGVLQNFFWTFDKPSAKMFDIFATSVAQWLTTYSREVCLGIECLVPKVNCLLFSRTNILIGHVKEDLDHCQKPCIPITP